jgi:NAD(P)-dependent dehydrogenase (short-subunit alcohol dehydrogenase family)
MNLTNARVWLTGASSGIGEALVAPLVARGARVAITARRARLLDTVAARHRDASVSPVVPVPADVTDRASVLAAADRVAALWDGIDLAIFNAGGRAPEPASGHGDPTSRTVFSADLHVGTMVLNYFSVVYGIEAVLPAMLARGSGRIAAVASLAGYRSPPRSGGYGPSKAAVIHLLEALRLEVENRGVGVTVINPGFVRTPLTASNRFPMPFLLEPDDAAERIVRGLERNRREIHFPAGLSWPLKVLRIVPYPVYARVLALVSRTR